MAFFPTHPNFKADEENNNFEKKARTNISITTKHLLLKTNRQVKSQ